MMLMMQAPAYGIVTSFLLPLAVPLLLLAADLRRVLRDTGRVLIAFIIGACKLDHEDYLSRSCVSLIMKDVNSHMDHSTQEMGKWG